MKVWLSGTLRLANGESPGFVHQSSGLLLVASHRVEFACSVVGGAAQVELDGELASLNTDELVRIGRAALEHSALLKVVQEGMGIVASIELIVSEPTGSLRVANDHAPATSPFLNADRCQRLLGVRPLFRWAVRDFNRGLIDREDCPLYFYRCIETLAKAVTGQATMDKNGWKAFHEKLGTSRSDLDVLKELADVHRHGSHDEFDEPRHLNMMETTLRFIRMSIDHLPTDTPPDLPAAPDLAGLERPETTRS